MTTNKRGRCRNSFQGSHGIRARASLGLFIKRRATPSCNCERVHITGLCRCAPPICLFVCLSTSVFSFPFLSTLFSLPFPCLVSENQLAVKVKTDLRCHLQRFRPTPQLNCQQDRSGYLLYFRPEPQMGAMGTMAHPNQNLLYTTSTPLSST